MACAQSGYVVPVNERLALPDSVDVELLAPDIVCCKGIFPWGRELISLANEIDEWKTSSQISPDNSESYTSDFRSSSSFYLTCHHREFGKRLAPFELAIMSALHTGAKAYKAYNSFCDITDDTGYEILKYEVGQEFKEHVDTVAGHGQEGSRQLTGLLYLNNDYEGGHTSFPRQSLTVSPDPGDLLLFPSNFVYPHVSPPVLSGEKYVVVTWFVAYPKRS